MENTCSNAEFPTPLKQNTSYTTGNLNFTFTTYAFISCNFSLFCNQKITLSLPKITLGCCHIIKIDILKIRFNYRVEHIIVNSVSSRVVVPLPPVFKTPCPTLFLLLLLLLLTRKYLERKHL